MKNYTPMLLNFRDEKVAVAMVFNCTKQFKHVSKKIYRRNAVTPGGDQMLTSITNTLVRD